MLGFSEVFPRGAWDAWDPTLDFDFELNVGVEPKVMRVIRNGAVVRQQIYRIGEGALEISYYSNPKRQDKHPLHFDGS